MSCLQIPQGWQKRSPLSSSVETHAIATTSRSLWAAACARAACSACRASVNVSDQNALEEKTWQLRVWTEAPKRRFFGLRGCDEASAAMEYSTRRFPKSGSFTV